MSTPRKRREIPLAKKKAIIESAKTESNNTKLAQRFGLALSTLRGILKEREAILGAIDSGSESKRIQRQTRTDGRGSYRLVQAATE